MNRYFILLASVICMGTLTATASAQSYCSTSGYGTGAFAGYLRTGYAAQPCNQPVDYGTAYGPVPYQSIGGRYGQPHGGYRRGLFPRVRRLLGLILPPYHGAY